MLGTWIIWNMNEESPDVDMPRIVLEKMSF